MQWVSIFRDKAGSAETAYRRFTTDYLSEGQQGLPHIWMNAYNSTKPPLKKWSTRDCFSEGQAVDPAMQKRPMDRFTFLCCSNVPSMHFWVIYWMAPQRTKLSFIPEHCPNILNGPVHIPALCHLLPVVWSSKRTQASLGQNHVLGPMDFNGNACIFFRPLKKAPVVFEHHTKSICVFMFMC